SNGRRSKRCVICCWKRKYWTPRRSANFVHRFPRRTGGGPDMAEMTIRLRCDPATGKKDIIVSLRSDADALPHEHEQLHQKLVEKLIHGGLVKPAEVGQVIVEREQPAGQQSVPSGEQPRRQSHKQGG